MSYKTFKYINPDEFHNKELTLHDCIADKITFENKALRFYLPDGFWVTPHHKENLTNKVVRTDASVVNFTVEDINEITVRVFTKNTWCWSRKETAEIWHIDQLISAINNNKCTIEFITQYRTYGEQLWQCVIHSPKKPYYRECQIYLPNATANYCWNKLCLDREW